MKEDKPKLKESGETTTKKTTAAVKTTKEDPKAKEPAGVTKKSTTPVVKTAKDTTATPAKKTQATPEKGPKPQVQYKYNPKKQLLHESVTYVLSGSGEDSSQERRKR